MPRTGMRRIPLALLASLALATAAIAVAGGLATSGSASAASDYSLLILPDQGESAIYSFINSATSSIDMTMYELRDTTVYNRPGEPREGRGHGPRHPGRRAEVRQPDARSTRCRPAGSASPALLPHSPTPTRRRSRSTTTSRSSSPATWTPTYYSTSRDYGVFDTDAGRRGRDRRACSTPTTPRPRSPRPTGTTWCGRPTDSQSHLLGADQRGASTASTSSRRSSATPRSSTPSWRPRTAA